MQATKTAEQESESIVTISFDTEHDRVRGVATLMRSSEWFRAVNKNQFVIKRKELGLFEAKNIKYSRIK
ncbi:MAG TPA: hypothetical protein VKA09_01285 [Nitrososphaeraceae archaeon]|nr:hypothetical protein [Nitrososphaeraceae archaeon]